MVGIRGQMGPRALDGTASGDGQRSAPGAAEVISIDWTFAHHERSEQIYGVKRSYDYVEKRMSRYQISCATRKRSNATSA
jgi:hypothetical protein